MHIKALYEDITLYNRCHTAVDLSNPNSCNLCLDLIGCQPLRGLNTGHLSCSVSRLNLTSSLQPPRDRSCHTTCNCQFIVTLWTVPAERLPLLSVSHVVLPGLTRVQRHCHCLKSITLSCIVNSASTSLSV